MTIIVFAKQIIVAFPGTAAALGGIATIAWPWYVLIGTAITLLVGILSSLTHGVSAADETRADSI
jgi:hypothetical protein